MSCQPQLNGRRASLRGWSAYKRVQVQVLSPALTTKGLRARALGPFSLIPTLVTLPVTLISSSRSPGQKKSPVNPYPFISPRPGHAGDSMPGLTREGASVFARLALTALAKEYPNKPEHVMAGPADVKGPGPSTRPSTGPTTGTPASTATGCSPGCSGSPPTSPRPPRSAPPWGANLMAGDLQAEGDFLARKECKPLRATVRVAVASEVGRATTRLGHPGREGVVGEPPAAGGGDLYPIPDDLPGAGLPDPHRRPPEHRLRAWPSPTTTPGRPATRGWRAWSRSGRTSARTPTPRPGGSRPDWTSSRRAWHRRT